MFGTNDPCMHSVCTSNSITCKAYNRGDLYGRRSCLELMILACILFVHFKS